MRTLLAGLMLTSGSASALAQAGYTFEMRLIADGMAGAPTPANSGPAYNIGDVNNLLPSRVGFWLQARVAQTVNQNWGIVRATSPAGGSSPSFISVTDAAGLSSLSRGQTGRVGLNNRFGRAAGYQNGGVHTGNTGNTAESAPFPGGTGNENGGLDNGGSGALTPRVFAFDAYVGSQRPGDGDPANNPWGINGGPQSAPHPSDGTFSPWATLYRVYLDVDGSVCRTISLTASAYLVAAAQATPTDDTFSVWQMQEGQGQLLTAHFTWSGCPTPSACSLLMMTGALGLRRRRNPLAVANRSKRLV